MKSVFFTSTIQDYSTVGNYSLSYLKSANQAVEALLTDVYCCPYMRMCMPCWSPLYDGYHTQYFIFNKQYSKYNKKSYENFKIYQIHIYL